MLTAFSSLFHPHPDRSKPDRHSDIFSENAERYPDKTSDFFENVICRHYQSPMFVHHNAAFSDSFCAFLHQKPCDPPIWNFESLQPSAAIGLHKTILLHLLSMSKNRLQIYQCVFYFFHATCHAVYCPYSVNYDCE